MFDHTNTTTGAQRPRKATNVEIRARVATVRAMIIRGASHAEIIRFGSESWSIGERGVEKYITTVNDELRAAARKDAERDLGLARERLERVIAESITEGDRKHQLAAIRELNKINGLHVNQVDLTSGGEKITLTVSPDMVPANLVKDKERA